MTLQPLRLIGRVVLLIWLWLSVAAASAQPVRSHYIRVADSKIYVEESSCGPALLLLHGGLLDHRPWAPHLNAWRRHFRVLNCDLRKHGLTQDGDSTFLNSAALAAVLDSLQAPTAYVLGHSLGSVAALALAYPGRVRRLVLAAPGLIGFELARDSALARGARRQEAARQCHDTLGYAESFMRVWVDGPHRQPAPMPPVVRSWAQQVICQNLTLSLCTTGPPTCSSAKSLPHARACPN